MSGQLGNSRFRTLNLRGENPSIPRTTWQGSPVARRESISSPQSLIDIAQERDDAVLRGIPRPGVVRMITEPSPPSAEVGLDRFRAFRDVSAPQRQTLVDPEHVAPRTGVVWSREDKDVCSFQVENVNRQGVRLEH